MKNTKTTRSSEKIELVIREMIEECEKIGRHPKQIKLSERDYKRLFNYLKEDVEMFYREKYEVVPTGVVYHSKPTPKSINTFMGLPVVKNDFTIVTWL